MGTNGLCDCASSFNCFNDAGRVVDGLHPVFVSGNQVCQGGGTNYTNSLGTHSGTSYVYFHYLKTEIGDKQGAISIIK